MKTLAEEQQARRMARHGRPPNAFRMSSTDFTRYWGTIQKEDLKFSLTTLQADTFGLVGYMVQTKRRTPVCRIALVPTSTSRQFYWVRLESVDGSLDFAFPAAVAAEDIPKLLELWEFYDDVTVWSRDGGIHCSLLPSPVYPKGWKVPGPYVGSSVRFLMLVMDENTRRLSTAARGGIHTMRATNANLAGVICNADDGEALRPFYVMEPLIRFPRTGSALSDAAIERFRAIGAQYAKHVLMEHRDEGCAQPYIPHPEIINMPVMTISKLNP